MNTQVIIHAFFSGKNPDQYYYMKDRIDIAGVSLTLVGCQCLLLDVK